MVCFSFNGDVMDLVGLFYVFVIYVFENVVKLEKVFCEEMIKVVIDGFMVEEIEVVKFGWL